MSQGVDQGVDLLRVDGALGKRSDLLTVRRRLRAQLLTRGFQSQRGLEWTYL